MDYDVSQIRCGRHICFGGTKGPVIRMWSTVLCSVCPPRVPGIDLENEDYPGQWYFWKHNRNTREAESKIILKQYGFSA